MDLKRSGSRMLAAHWHPVAACAALPSLNLEAWCLDAWMLAGLEEIGGGDGGDGGDWNGRRRLEARLTRSSFRSSAAL